MTTDWVPRFSGDRMRPELPVATVVCRRGQAVVVECPFCGDVHFHGHGEADPTSPGDSFGTRISHCLVGGCDMYELIIAPTGTVEPKPLRVRYDRVGRPRLVPRRIAS